MKERRHIIKPDFPLIELTFISALIFTLALTIRQIIITGEKDYFYVFPIILFGLIYGYYFTNYRNKKIYIKESEFVVKPLLKKLKKYNKSNILGYELYETFDRTGLIKQIRLVDTKGKKIIFAKDAYSDYDKLIQMIINFGFKKLEEKELNWKYKRQYGIFVGACFILAMLIFALLRLL